MIFGITIQVRLQPHFTTIAFGRCVNLSAKKVTIPTPPTRPGALTPMKETQKIENTKIYNFRYIYLLEIAEGNYFYCYSMIISAFRIACFGVARAQDESSQDFRADQVMAEYPFSHPNITRTR